MVDWRFVLVLLTLAGCSAPVWYVHDRHATAAGPVATFATAHPGTTLVLLDYHHDAGGTEDPLASFNWAGRLVADGTVGRVVWVSAWRFGPGQRESRRQWLARSVVEASPGAAERLLSAYQVFDGADLAPWTPAGPVVLSLDLDLLAHDAGPDPGAFLDELSAWASAQRPPLVTVALSAAYQADPKASWSWLARWVGAPAADGADLVLEAGPWSPGPESREEQEAWSLWQTQPLVYQSAFGGSFWPGAGLWWGAPAEARRALLSRRVTAGDPSAQALLAAWTDPARADLEARVPPATLAGWLGRARSAVARAWDPAEPAEPVADPRAEAGVAVRVLNRGTDRGCLAWYRGVKDFEPVIDWCASQALLDPRYPPVLSAEAPDLSVEVSVFGPWVTMASPLDFSPGFDSLLLVDGDETTLLQASLAVERSYDRETFLSRLSRKAGLGPDGWKAPEVRFRRAPTLWALAPLVQDGGDQKNEKK